ncbi:MAG: hypothetical protein HYV60_04575 [Planctomycetia bacterium]|nr:hypothetical protein [Planctomycetia bacterium]
MRSIQTSSRFIPSNVLAMLVFSASIAHAQSGTRNDYSQPTQSFAAPQPSLWSQPFSSPGQFNAPQSMPQPVQSFAPQQFQSFAPPTQSFSAPAQFGSACSSMTAQPFVGVPTVTQFRFPQQFAAPVPVQTFRPVPVQTFPGVPVQTFRPVMPGRVSAFRPFMARQPIYMAPVYRGF